VTAKPLSFSANGTLSFAGSDVFVYRTDTLTEDVTIAGEIVAKLLASTTGSDGDWIVKLIVTGSWCRGRVPRFH
jgi:predicted acyl esterase